MTHFDARKSEEREERREVVVLFFESREEWRRKDKIEVKTIGCILYVFTEEIRKDDDGNEKQKI